MKTLEIKKLSLFAEINQWRKLSDFYNRKTTNLAGVFFSDLFTISYNKEEIVKNGFNSLVRAIIKPNENNPVVVDFFIQKEINNKNAEIAKLAEKEKFDNKVIEAKKYILEHSEKVNHLIEKHGITSKGLQIVAWKLSNYTIGENYITKTQFYHAL